MKKHKNISKYEKAVVLFSGGQDSTTCLAYALHKFNSVEAIGFNYGQRHNIELIQAQKIADKLNHLYQNDKEKFLTFYSEIETIIKYASMQDEKFYKRIKDLLIWKNTKDEWTTIDEYISRNLIKTKGKIFYAQNTSHNQILDLYAKKDFEVLIS